MKPERDGDTQTDVGGQSANGRLDAALDEQERRWLAGERVPAEDILAAAPDLAAEPEHAVQVVYHEFLLREGLGEAPAIVEYRERFPRLITRLEQQLALRQALDEDEGLARSARTAGDGPLTSPGEPEAPPADAVPSVPGYDLLAELGRGGMGVVYKARQVSLGRTVALKMILAGEFAGAAARARFLAEAEVVASLRHTNIVQVYDFGSHDGRPYFSMEYIDGGTLADRIKAGPLESGAAAALVRDVARAMQHAHSLGVVHRDLKPANILLASGGRQPPDNSDPSGGFRPPLADLGPKVTDFGLARRERSDLTESGAIVGTPSYMAPEQAGGGSRRISPATDVWALGAILYECLTGRPPFQGHDALATLRQVVDQEPAPVHSLRRGLPRDLVTVCHKCLQKDPTARYSSAAALADDLDRVLRDEPVTARPVGRPERLWRWCRRNPTLAGLSAALLLLLVAAAVGSTVAAARFQEQRDEAVGLLGRATTAEAGLTRTVGELQSEKKQRTRQLFESQLAAARVSRLSRRLGQRHETLRSVGEALATARGLELSGDDLVALRTEVAAALALPDLRVAREIPQPLETAHVEFDPALEHYTRASPSGLISVRRFADDAELWRVQAEPNAYGVPSPDGKGLMVLNAGNLEATLWRRGAAAGVRIIHPVYAFAFSPDGKTFATLSVNGMVALYNAEGKTLFRWAYVAEPRRRGTLAFHPSLPLLAAASNDTVTVLDLDRDVKIGAKTRRGAWLAPAAVHSLDWDPAGKSVAVGCEDTNIYLWDMEKSQVTHTLRGHQSGGVRVAFRPGGGLLASVAWDSVLRLWDVHTGEENFSTRSTWWPVRFSPDGSRLTVHPNRRAGIWEVETARAFRTLATSPPGPAGNFLHPAFSADGRLLVCCQGDSLLFWDAEAARPAGTLPADALSRPGAAFEPDGSLWTVRGDGLVRWPAEVDATGVTFGPPEPLRVPGLENAGGLSRNADASVLAVPTGNGAVVVHTTGKPRHVPVGPQHRASDPRIVSLSSDGKLVATGSHGTSGVKVWDADSGRLIKHLDAGRTCMVSFSPEAESRWLISGASGFRVWEVEGWRQRWQIDGYFAQAFSPDGQVLAVQTERGPVALIDLKTGRELLLLEHPREQPANELSFSPDGGLLASSNGNWRSLHVWDLRRIRARLKGLGLDSDHPPLPSPPEGEPAPLTVRFIGAAVVDRQQRRDTFTVIERTMQLAMNPLDGAAYLDRGRALNRLGEHDAALEDFGRAIASRPDDAAAYYERGRLLSEREREPERARQARHDLTEALRLAPKHPDAHHRRAHAHELLGQFTEALADCDEAIRRRKDDSHLHAMRGGYLLQLGRYAEGVKELERSLTIKKGDPLASEILARLRLLGPAEWRDEKAAVTLAERAAAQDRQAEARYTLALARYRQGRYRESREALVGLGGWGRPDIGWEWYLRALLDHKEGQAERSAGHLRLADQWLQTHRARLTPLELLYLGALRDEATRAVGKQD